MPMITGVLLGAADAQLPRELTRALRRAERATEMPLSGYEPSLGQRVHTQGALPR